MTLSTIAVTDAAPHRPMTSELAQRANRALHEHRERTGERKPRHPIDLVVTQDEYERLKLETLIARLERHFKDGCLSAPSFTAMVDFGALETEHGTVRLNIDSSISRGAVRRVLNGNATKNDLDDPLLSYLSKFAPSADCAPNEPEVDAISEDVERSSALDNIEVHFGVGGRVVAVDVCGETITNVLGAAIGMTDAGRPVVALALSPRELRVTQAHAEHPTHPDSAEGGECAGPASFNVIEVPLY